MSKIDSLARGFSVFLIMAYRASSPFFRLVFVWPSVCRFFPSCSEVMLESIKSSGVVHGFRVGLERICRCHPFYSEVGHKRGPG